MTRKPSKLFIYSAVTVLIISVAFVQLYKEAAPRRKAREIWRGHERVVVDAAAGRRVHLDEFADAVLFFERLSEIHVPSDHSTFIDAMPIKDTSLAVGPIQHWYQENKYKLYWDEQNREVRLGDKNLAPWAVLP